MAQKSRKKNRQNQGNSRNTGSQKQPLAAQSQESESATAVLEADPQDVAVLDRPREWTPHEPSSEPTAGEELELDDDTGEFGENDIDRFANEIDLVDNATAASTDPLKTLAENCVRQSEDTKPAAEAPLDSLHSTLQYNTELIEQLIVQVSYLGQNGWQQNPSADDIADSHTSVSDACAVQTDDQIAELQHRNDELIRDLNTKATENIELKKQVAELENQSKDLAGQLATQNVRETLATTRSGSADAMTWEERKQLIFQQMENNTFDANEFVASLSGDQQAAIRSTTHTDSDADESEQVSPIEFVQRLTTQLERAEQELESRNEEIGELKVLLEQQSETRDSGIAIGAAAIAQMVDSDELVAQERERLQELQDQWEEKFRRSEIEASLERAKLSRERQEVAQKNAELQEQLAHLRREVRQSEESGGVTSGRWFAKLGLAE